jgi:hypothetical protein
MNCRWFSGGGLAGIAICARGRGMREPAVRHEIRVPLRSNDGDHPGGICLTIDGTDCRRAFPTGGPENFRSHDSVSGVGKGALWLPKWRRGCVAFQMRFDSDETNL